MYRRKRHSDVWWPAAYFAKQPAGGKQHRPRGLDLRYVTRFNFVLPFENARRRRDLNPVACLDLNFGEGG